ncbi:hypothetical protein K469DRAFT_714522 [Zopfia rhizophila CBS 207.26]|uniref:Bacteriophage T5 Orf172 DNA-binding domain-containing protein n=1 Tax=Zopfia rhizophila CBS 207.26 TaxID=1314779 RepID=A0A6A6DNI7_9PEZI|nr:hypothetical protein K469DRAFT_714522 [Zopfia rhizophila CBS 207.26]
MATIYTIPTIDEIIAAFAAPYDRFNCIAAVNDSRCTEIVELHRRENITTYSRMLLQNLDNLPKLMDLHKKNIFWCFLCVSHQTPEILEGLVRRWNQNQAQEEVEERTAPITSRILDTDGGEEIETSDPTSQSNPQEPFMSGTSPVGTEQRISRTSSPAPLIRLVAGDPFLVTPRPRSRLEEVAPSNQTYDRQRPLIFESQSEPRLNPTQRLPHLDQDTSISVTPRTPSTSTSTVDRPSLPRRRPVSDRQYDRIGRRSVQQQGSPFRRRRRVPQHSTRPVSVQGLEDLLREPSDAESRASGGDGPLEEASTTIDAYASHNLDRKPPLTALQIDDALRKKIKAQLTKNETTMGIVYIFRDRDPTRSRLLKIGMTTQGVSDRQREIERKCKIELDHVYSSLQFNNYRRAEKLAQIELENLYRPYQCPSSTCGMHKEWFEVSEDLAKRTVQRWVDFMRQNPYEDGQLKAMWKDRLANMTPPAALEDSLLCEDPLRHNLRWERWRFVEPPSILVRWENAITHCVTHPVWAFMWEFIWQISCVGCWIFIFLYFRNPITLWILLAFMISTLISISVRISKGERREVR